MEIIRKERRGDKTMLFLKCDHEIEIDNYYRGGIIICMPCEGLDIRKRKSRERARELKKKQERLIPAY